MVVGFRSRPMSVPKKIIKIFVSSPSDVADERMVAKRVINTLASQYAYYANIEPVLSEKEALPALETPQSNIPEPSSTDIFIVLLWSRLGTPIQDPRYREHPDGPPMTGTEWEFFNAATSFNKSRRPFVLAYRKRAKVFIDRDDDAEIERGREQKRMLEAFERRWFRDGEGSWKGYYHSFETIDQLEVLLDEHLHECLRIEFADTTRSDDPVAPRHWPGSPFRGLAAFDVSHTLIFCGRAKALADLRTKLRDEIVRGVAFVLVTGASGAGKSSLVRAGLVASLLDEPALVANNALVRYAIIRPGVATRNVGEALRLSVTLALPELQAFGLDRDPLAAPEHLEAAIDEALTRAERGASLPPELRARLVLVIDQLEELFTIFARYEANRFVDVVDRLVRSGRVWVVATLRGDFFSHLDDFPKLSKLAETGLFRLAGPQPPEIAQMIRRPAAIGGIRFERHPDTDVPLDSLILGEAAGDPGSLPLLEFILDELWHRRTPDGLITYKEYENLGRLSGGIARRAEDVAANLEKNEAPEVGAAIDAVLESLVT